MQITIPPQILKFFFLFCSLFVSFQGVYAECENEEWPEGEYMRDCNGNCFPMLWLFDEICDDLQREWPVGSGILIDLSCEDFYCDVFACEGCNALCPVGEIPDCNGNCAPAEWIVDEICDVGQRSYNGNQIVFACEEYGCDAQNCPGVCFSNNGYWDLSELGACCMGEDCAIMSRADCWQIEDAIYMGPNLLCQSNTCGCGVGFIADCDGNCIELGRATGNYCAHGEYIDPDGVWDNGDEFYTNLNCPELACGAASCIGNCIGACCYDGDCFVANTFQNCLDIGGIFLGSYTSCSSEACEAYQQPIQLPDTEIYWSGDLGVVEEFPRWIAIDGSCLIAGVIIPGDEDGLDHPRNGVCVYRYIGGDVDEWIEEALLVVPENRSIMGNPRYAIQNKRIAIVSTTDWQTINERNVIDIFRIDSASDTWFLEGTIDEGITSMDIEYPWPSSIDIYGDVLVAGYPSLNQDLKEPNYGGVYLYHFNDGAWEHEDTILPMVDGSLGQEDSRFGMTVALDDGITAVMSGDALSIYDISDGEGVGLQFIPEVTGHNHPSPHSLDIDEGRIMTTVGRPDGDWDSIGSGIFEHNGTEWVLTSILSLFDYVADDMAGYIVDLSGSTALITSPNDDDLGYETGSGYLWEHNGSSWVFKAKLWSDWADAGDQFGIGAAIHDSSVYMTGNLEADGDCIKVFSPRNIAWINPNSGNIMDSVNWDPTMPTKGDTVSFSLRSSRTDILVDGDFPFSSMFIGPGEYVFELQDSNPILDSPGEAINIQGVPGFGAELQIQGGLLQVNGDVYIGEDEFPGKISLVSSKWGMARMHIDGTFVQHEGGVSLIELDEYSEAPMQITGNVPLLNGVLELNLAHWYTPQIGDEIPLLSADNVDSTAGQFSMVLVNDPMPDGLYIRLDYIQGDGSRDNSGTIYAVVDELANLFGYGDPNSETVAGTATDVLLTDLGSSDRTVDGFDDIVVTTTDTVYVFLSDGAGGIASQATYNHTGFTSLAAVDAGDLDGDGTNDLVVVNSDSDQFIPIYNELNDINFLTIGDYESTGPNPTDVIVMNTDFDADEDVIIACKGYTLTDGVIEFFTSEPSFTGGFSRTGSLASPGHPGKIDPGDVNNDKDFSIHVSFEGANSVGKASQTTEVRGSSWSYVDIAQVPIGPQNLVTGDINGDSIEDVIVACPTSDTLSILLGSAAAGFADPLQLFVGIEPTSLALLDFDNDGDKDIAVIASNSTTFNRAVMMYRNDTSLNGGNLMFAQDSYFDDGARPVLVAKGDIDGDSHDDLISITRATSLRGVTGTGVNLRGSETQVSCPADFDGNGDVNVLDLLTIIGAWGNTGTNPEDLDGNGVVNVLDLLILIAAWGPCT